MHTLFVDIEAERKQNLSGNHSIDVVSSNITRNRKRLIKTEPQGRSRPQDVS